MWGIQVRSPKLKPSITIGLLANESVHKITNFIQYEQSRHSHGQKFTYEYSSMNHESFIQPHMSIIGHEVRSQNESADPQYGHR